MMLNLLFKTLRIKQYLKNLFVFLPIFFGGGLSDPSLYLPNIITFICFCLVASFVYILNDIKDVEEDRLHPTKKFRPIAHCDISISSACFLAAFLLLFSFFIAYFYVNTFLLCLLFAYIILNLFYIFYGKKKSLLDVTCIAISFELRTISGSFALRTISGSFACSYNLSSWLLLMVFLLSMFLALSKRWDDLCIIEDDSLALECKTIRKSLNGYNKNFVLAAMTFLCAVNSVCYIMYTFDQHNIVHYNNTSLLTMTSIWVILGNIRYLQISFVSQKSTSPTNVLLKDLGIKFCVFCWIVNLYLLLYL